MRHSFYTKSITLFLAIALVMPPALLSAPQRAEAQVGLGSCVAVGAGVGAAASTAAGALGGMVPVTAPINESIVSTHAGKECLLDGLVSLVREVMIAALVRSTVNWINSGFEGSPAFITDLEGFMADVADQAVGEFIYGTPLAFLCSPFQAKIRITLGINYRSRGFDPPRCTLTGITGNIENFLNGSFYDGGWPAFVELVYEPGNHPFLGLLDLEFELQGAINRRVKASDTELAWGDGIQPFKICEPLSAPTAEEGRVAGSLAAPTPEVCETVTPGTYINHQLNQVGGTSLRSLELADEIDEIIGALLQQLTRQALSSFRGLSQSGSSGSSYLDQIYDDSANRAEVGFKDTAATILNEGIQSENRFQTAKEGVLARLATSEAKLGSLAQCYREKLSSNSLTLSDEEEDTARERIAAASSTVASNIAPLRQSAENDIAQSERNIEDMIALELQVENATSSFEVDRIMQNQINPLFGSGRIHNNTAVAAAQQQQRDVDDIMSTLDAQTDEKIAICQAFPEDEQTIE